MTLLVLGHVEDGQRSHRQEDVRGWRDRRRGERYITANRKSQREAFYIIADPVGSHLGALPLAFDWAIESCADHLYFLLVRIGQRAESCSRGVRTGSLLVLDYDPAEHGILGVDESLPIHKRLAQ